MSAARPLRARRTRRDDHVQPAREAQRDQRCAACRPQRGVGALPRRRRRVGGDRHRRRPGLLRRRRPRTTAPERPGTWPGSFWEIPTVNSFESGLEVWKPTIAAVNGYCLGYGLTAVSACDFVIAADDAEFGMPEVRLGVPTIVGAMRLPRRIGDAGRARAPAHRRSHRRGAGARDRARVEGGPARRPARGGAAARRPPLPGRAARGARGQRDGAPRQPRCPGRTRFGWARRCDVSWARPTTPVKGCRPPRNGARRAGPVAEPRRRRCRCARSLRRRRAGRAGSRRRPTGRTGRGRRS